MSRSLDGTKGGEDCRDAGVNVRGDVHRLGENDLAEFRVSKLGRLNGNEIEYIREWNHLHLVVLSIVNTYHESRPRCGVLGFVTVKNGDGGCDASRVVIHETRTVAIGCLADRLTSHLSLVLHRLPFLVSAVFLSAVHTDAVFGDESAPLSVEVRFECAPYGLRFCTYGPPHSTTPGRLCTLRSILRYARE